MQGQSRSSYQSTTSHSIETVAIGTLIAVFGFLLVSAFKGCAAPQPHAVHIRPVGWLMPGWDMDNWGYWP